MLTFKDNKGQGLVEYALILVLVELYELTPQEHERRLERQRGLADRVLREGQVMTAAVMGFLNTFVWGGAAAQAEEAPVERPNGY